MANTGMLRGSPLRTQRTSVDTGTGEKRMGNAKRAQHLGRGSFVNFYDDLGISTTPDTASNLRKDEAAFQKQVGERKGAIGEAQNKYNQSAAEVARARDQLNSSSSGIPNLNDALGKAWNTQQQSLTKIRVMGPGDKVEATYYLPADGAATLQGQRGIFASQHDGNFMNVMVKDYRNQELHDALRESETSYRTQWQSSAQKQIAGQIGEAQNQYNQQMSAAQGQLGQAEGALAGHKASIDVAGDELAGAEKIRQDQWNDIHDRYNKRIETMKEIFGGLKVG